MIPNPNHMRPLPLDAERRGRACREPRPRRRRVLDSVALALAPVAVAAVLVTIAAGCGGGRRQRAPQVAVTVATVEERGVPIDIVASGTVEPVQSADVGSQVGGVVIRIEFREGQDVRVGQPLVQLDPRPFQAALEQARGALGRDHAQWENARLEAERSRSLAEQNVISSADYEQKQAAADAYRAAVSADSGAVANARLNLQFATIRAPIAGRTGDLAVHVGDLVKAGTSEPLVTINRLQPILVRFAVAERELPLIQRYRQGDRRVEASVPGDTAPAVGRLTFVDNAVDAATGTLLLKGEFTNEDGLLWPGQFVRVRLILAVEPHAIVVPAPAVVTGQQGTYVYVLQPDSTVAPRPVTVARSADDVAVVAGGLKPGEVVVTDGQFRLSPGARVLIRQGAQGKRP